MGHDISNLAVLFEIDKETKIRGSQQYSSTFLSRLLPSWLYSNGAIQLSYRQITHFWGGIPAT